MLFHGARDRLRMVALSDIPNWLFIKPPIHRNSHAKSGKGASRGMSALPTRG
jgi:hypothetical protein